MKEIKIQELENIKIGSAENKDAATGCTVILCEQGMAAGWTYGCERVRSALDAESLPLS